MGYRTFRGGGPARRASVSKGTDVPLPKLLDSFCLGVVLTGDISYLCDMGSLDCPAR